MKKITKVAALLAASALLFGGMFLSCSDSDDDGNTSPVSGPSSNSGSGNSGSGNSGDSGNQTETEYKWDFQNIDLSKISVKAWEGQSTASKIHTDYTVGDLANVVLTADYSIASNPAALTLTLEKEKGEYNLIDNDKASGDAKKELGASNGCIDPNADAVVSTSVKGPFTVKMFVSANSESDKTDRHAFIKIGDQTYTDSTYAEKVPGPGYWHSASYTGTDTVTVQFGGTGIVRIWDIVITSSAEQTSASGSGSESGSGESSSTSTTYTLSMDGATITIVAKTDGTYTASMDGTEVESGTYTLSADGKTVTTTSAKGATSYTIGDNNVLTVVTSGEGTEGGSTGGSSEQGSTVTADWVAGTNKYSDGTLTGTNCTWTWATDGASMQDKTNYIVQIGKGSTNKNVATLNVKGACKVTVTFRYGGDHDASKIRDLDIGGVNKPMDSSTDKAKDYTVEYTATVAGDIAVKGNGVNIKEIKVE